MLFTWYLPQTQHDERHREDVMANKESVPWHWKVETSSRDWHGRLLSGVQVNREHRYVWRWRVIWARVSSNSSVRCPPDRRYSFDPCGVASAPLCCLREAGALAVKWDKECHVIESESGAEVTYGTHACLKRKATIGNSVSTPTINETRKPLSRSKWLTASMHASKAMPLIA